MPAGYGVGDHRLFVVDFLTRTLIGVQPEGVRRPCARRLNCKIPGCKEAYAGPLEEQLARYWVTERLEAVTALTTSASRKKVVIDALDKESGDYMRHAKHHCRRMRKY